MRFRPACIADQVAILVMGQTMVAELRPNLTFDLVRAMQTVDRALRAGTIFVVEEAYEVVGFLIAARIDYAACSGFYVEQQLFYVRPDKRGTRAAAVLFAGFVRWAESQRPEEVFAGIGWGRRSAAAARWIGRFGFEPAGQQIMRRQVGQH